MKTTWFLTIKNTSYIQMSHILWSNFLFHFCIALGKFETYSLVNNCLGQERRRENGVSSNLKLLTLAYTQTLKKLTSSILSPQQKKNFSTKKLFLAIKLKYKFHDITSPSLVSNWIVKTILRQGVMCFCTFGGTMLTYQFNPSLNKYNQDLNSFSSVRATISC